MKLSKKNFSSTTSFRAGLLDSTSSRSRSSSSLVVKRLLNISRTPRCHRQMRVTAPEKDLGLSATGFLAPLRP